MEKKILAVLIVFVAVAGFVLGYHIFVNPKGEVNTQMITGTVKEDIPEDKKEAATFPGEDLGEPEENAEDIAGAITDQFLSEEEEFVSEETDAEDSFINQAQLDDFGQSYDENKF
jgi:hypothetical protein